MPLVVRTKSSAGFSSGVSAKFCSSGTAGGAISATTNFMPCASPSRRYLFHTCLPLPFSSTTSNAKNVTKQAKPKRNRLKLRQQHTQRIKSHKQNTPVAMTKLEIKVLTISDEFSGFAPTIKKTIKKTNAVAIIKISHPQKSPGG